MKMGNDRSDRPSLRFHELFFCVGEMARCAILEHIF